MKVAADGKSLDPAGVTWILNPYDEFAIEQALQLKDGGAGGEVVVLTVGGAGVQSTLRNALAMGADRGIHLKTDAALDSLAVARALADAVKDLDAKIVWLGKQAVDDDAAQVGPMVAEQGRLTLAAPAEAVGARHDVPRVTLLQCEAARRS